MTKARSNATANAAKGDLTVGSGTNLSSVLGVGSNGDTIVADASTATGLRYQVPVNVNPCLNSNFSVWQRGTSFAGTGTQYTADRWMSFVSATGSPVFTFSRQVTNDTTNLPFIQYCMRIQRTSGQTFTSVMVLAQDFETVNSIPYAGKTVTMSFYARKGANYSSASDALSYSVITGTGTDQNNFTVGYTGSATPLSGTATLTTTWQRFSTTATLAATATELEMRFNWTPSGTAGAADYAEITGVQLEVGSVATPYKPTGATFQGELAACQRYYWQVALGSSLTLGSSFYFTSTQAEAFIQYPVTMRTTPVLIATTGVNYYRTTYNGGLDAFDSLTINAANNQNTRVYNNTEASGAAGSAGIFFTNNASSSVAFSAEL